MTDIYSKLLTYMNEPQTFSGDTVATYVPFYDSLEKNHYTTSINSKKVEYEIIDKPKEFIDDGERSPYNVSRRFTCKLNDNNNYSILMCT